MNNILERLWYDHLSTEALRYTDEEKAAMTKLVQTEEILIKGLSDEQKELLNIWNSCIDEISAISTMQAFISGVKFTASFLFEAFEKNK